MQGTPCLPTPARRKQTPRVRMPGAGALLKANPGRVRTATLHWAPTGCRRAGERGGATAPAQLRGRRTPELAPNPRGGPPRGSCPRGAGQRKAGGGGAGRGGAWGAGCQVSVGSHLLRNEPAIRLRRADPGRPESAQSGPGEFRVPRAREHVACPPSRLSSAGLGRGSPWPVQRPRSAGVRLLPAGDLERNSLTLRISGQGLLEGLGRGLGSSPPPPPSGPGLPGGADPGGQPPRAPSGLGQHGLR